MNRASSRSRQIAVVGSGFGGLATAVRLQTRGFNVHLFEARDKPGGGAYVYQQEGFTFDGGPTVITAPFLIDELFEGAGRKTSDYVRIVPIEPFYRIEFHDGRRFEYGSDEAETERRVAELAPADLPGYRRMLQHAKAVFEKGFVELADKPFLKFRDMLRIAPDLIRLQSYKTVYQFATGYVKDPLLRRVFSFHPLLVGGNPFQTTSLYALIHYLERQWGVHYAMGGTGAIVAGLGKLFCELGGHIHLSTPVSKIVVENGAATGIETERGHVLPAGAVVSNADVANTYLKMIEPRWRKKYHTARLARMRYSMSLFVIYFGTDRQYPGLKHHTIILGERYRGLLDDIFNKKLLSEDFSLYLHRPSATDPSMAPEGCDCFYVLAPVPNQKSGIDWRIQAKPFRDAILRFLNDRYMPGLLNHIISERLLTPLDFETTLNTYLGSGFSFEPIFRQSAWFRPHNESEDVRNLFFVGAGTHPGAGVPGVLSSAKITEQLICQRLLN
ncbi:MAG TPA: phytoene desaturase [Bryobacteraceae bacterium]|nr:phytoene desaturase [Bryobacteraceae bacterium]